MMESLAEKVGGGSRLEWLVAFFAITLGRRVKLNIKTKQKAEREGSTVPEVIYSYTSPFFYFLSFPPFSPSLPSFLPCFDCNLLNVFLLLSAKRIWPINNLNI
jgi:hypothetical protein